MEALFQYMVKASLIMTVMYSYYHLFLMKKTFYSTNRFYLLTIIFLSSVIPLIKITISLNQTNVVQEDSFIYSILLSDVKLINQTAYGQSSFPHFLFILYGIGVIVFLLNNVISAFKLRSFIRKFKYRKLGNIKVIKLPEHSTFCSFFNILFYNDSIENANDIHKIFSHEKVHIKQLHSIDIVLANLFCIVFWYNPFAWMLRNSIKQNHEYIADKKVIERFQASSYLELLLKQSMSESLSFMNYFACSNLKKRMIMMTKLRNKNVALYYLPALLLVSILFIGISCNKGKSEKVETETIKTEDASRTEDDIFQVVEEVPQFPENVNQWIREKVRYPVEAQQGGIQGRVYVQFVIEKDGSVTNVNVARPVNEYLDKEAVRVVEAMPKWEPGKQRGQAVRVSYTVPINFQLQ